MSLFSGAVQILFDGGLDDLAIAFVATPKRCRFEPTIEVHIDLAREPLGIFGCLLLHVLYVTRSTHWTQGESV